MPGEQDYPHDQQQWQQFASVPSLAKDLHRDATCVTMARLVECRTPSAGSLIWVIFSFTLQETIAWFPLLK